MIIDHRFGSISSIIHRGPNLDSNLFKLFSAFCNIEKTSEMFFLQPWLAPENVHRCTPVDEHHPHSLARLDRNLLTPTIGKRRRGGVGRSRHQRVGIDVSGGGQGQRGTNPSLPVAQTAAPGPSRRVIIRQLGADRCDIERPPNRKLCPGRRGNLQVLRHPQTSSCVSTIRLRVQEQQRRIGSFPKHH